MNYSLFLLPEAQKHLARIPSPYFERVEAAISNLAHQPRPHNSKKLVARPGWRIRINDYRVIYKIDDKTKQVIILDVGHRKHIYI